MEKVKEPSASAVRPPRALIAGLLWCIVIGLGIALTGCPRFTLFYGIFLALSLGVFAGALFFLGAIYQRGLTRLLPACKKFTGYANVVFYVAFSLPRVEWEAGGLITDGRAVFLYAVTLAGLLTGIAFYFFIRHDPAFPKVNKTDKKEKSARRGIVAHVLEWADALASAAILVLLIETFLFQLYQVPSESMVPVFLAGDRPFTLKVDAGPRLPLTDWRLPFLKKPERGDVVTIANPRYPENSGVNLKKYLSQMVYMVTFTLVNIDKTAADGTPKSDPLVKRIVGVPGEKLMMVDDVLYARTAADAEFRAVAVDRDRFAQIDLWKLPPTVRAHVREIRANEQTRAVLARWDAAKNGTDAAALASARSARWDRLAFTIAAMPSAARDAFERVQLPRTNPAITTFRDKALRFAPAGRLNPLSLMGADAEDFSLALASSHSPATLAALKEYALSGNDVSSASTAYERGSYALNLIVKANLIDRIQRDIELISAGATLETVLADPKRGELVQEAKELALYLGAYYDMRNFPEFPAGDSFLGPDQYFAMGDNRYNSLDFRFAESYQQRTLDPSDPVSIVYPSALAPFPLEKRFIEGYARFRLWPLSRWGVIR